MSILDIFQRKKKVQQPRAQIMQTFSGMNDPLLLEFIRSAGGSLSAETALGIAAVWRCVSIISGTIAGLPLHVMEDDPVEPRIKNKATAHPLYRVLYSSPNEWQTSSEFRSCMMINLLLFGNAYARVTRGTDGNVLALHPLRAEMMSVKVESDASIIYTYTPGDGRRIEIPRRDMFHLRDMSVDGLTGQSRMLRMKSALGLAVAMEVYASAVFTNGAQYKGFIELPPGTSISAEALARLRDSINATTGASNAHSTMILEDGAKYNATGQSNEDAQLRDGRSFQISEIAMFFGVPPHMLGDNKATTSWGTGIEQQNIGFLQYTIQPWITCWEQAIARDLIIARDSGRIYAKFNLSGLLRASSSDRASYFSSALGSGGGMPWMTPNEVRALDELPPLKDGDGIQKPVPATGGVGL